MANGQEIQTQRRLINLISHNDAILLKQLHEFYNKKDVTWVQLICLRYYGSFWLKDLLRLSVLYREIARCSIGDGSTITFWEDL